MTAAPVVVMGLLLAALLFGSCFISLLHRGAVSVSLDGQNRLTASAPPGLARPIAWRERLGALLDVCQNQTTLVSGLSKTEAEDLLDWLEANGYEGRQVTIAEDGFAVRFNK